MRRALSISLILLLWLPAIAAVLPGSADSRLPFCCRRHGAHHCAMDAATDSAQSPNSGHVVNAPSRCPQFPGAIPATISPAFVTASAPAEWPALTAGIYARVARRDAARAGRLNAQLDRGPPSLAPA
jgi:hypothetical protein